MSPEERKTLRDDVLQEIYDHHFKNNGSLYQLSKQQLRKDTERNLAIEYLVDKGYLRKESRGMDNLVLSITSYGIDYIESK